MVEAFSLRGLSRLAESWRVDPPFPEDNEFGTAIADYQQNISNVILGSPRRKDSRTTPPAGLRTTAARSKWLGSIHSRRPHH
jgi:hypothetical protein